MSRKRGNESVYVDDSDNDDSDDEDSANGVVCPLHARIAALESLVHVKQNELDRLGESSTDKLICMSNELARLHATFKEHKGLASREMERERAAIDAILQSRKNETVKAFAVAYNIIETGDSKIDELQCVVDEQQCLIGHLEADLSKSRSAAKKFKTDVVKSNTSQSGCFLKRRRIF